MSDNYLKELFIDEVKGALNQGGGGGITELPEHLKFGEVKTQLIFEVSHGPISANDGKPTYTLFTGDQKFKKTDTLIFEIRDDVFEVNSYFYDGYYNFQIWGTYDVYDQPVENPYPFAFYAGADDYCWDENGYHMPNYTLSFGYREEVYPGLDFDTEVRIYRKDVKPINLEYLPEHLQFGETIEAKNIYNTPGEDFQLEGFGAFDIGDTVTITVDGVEYSLVAYDDEGYVTIGDPYTAVQDGTGELGWQVYMDNYNGYALFASNSKHVLGTTTETVIKTLDPKYLPEHLKFGEETKMAPITWDGDISSKKVKEYGSDNGVCLVYPGVFPTPDDLIGSTVNVLWPVYTEEGQTPAPISVTLTEDMIDYLGDGGYCFNYNNVVSRALVEVRPGDGLYLMYMTSNDEVVYYVTDINYLVPQTVVKPIDTKYLPEPLQFGYKDGELTLVFFDDYASPGAGTADWFDCTLSGEPLVELNPNKKYVVIFDGEEYICNCTTETYSYNSNMGYTFTPENDGPFIINAYADSRSTQFTSLQVRRTYKPEQGTYPFKLYQDNRFVRKLDPKYLPSNVVTGTIQWPEEDDLDYAPIINIDKSATEIAGMLKAGTLLFFRDHNEYSDSYYPIVYSSFYGETEFECLFEAISTQNGLESYEVWLWTNGDSVEGEVGYRDIDDNIMPDMDNIILASPNGTQYKLTVSDDGTLSATIMTVE